MKNKRVVKILFVMLAMLFFVLISKSFNSVDAADFSGPFTNAYDMSGPWKAYCREHGKALGGDVGGLPIQRLQYTQTSGSQQIEPATGYALYCGASGESLQHVMWYSQIWTGGGNSVVDAGSGIAGIDQKYKEYGDVYYGIIKPFKDINSTNKNLFSITSDVKEENVKVMVNQQNKKYIVGPYKIEINPNIQSYTTSSSSITDGIDKLKNSLSEELKNEEENINSQTMVYPVETASSISFGDVSVNTKDAYANGATYKAPTSLQIDGKTISETDNIATHSKSIYDSDKNVFEKAESDLQQAQSNLNDLEQKVNEAKEKSDSSYAQLQEQYEQAQQTYNEKKEAYDNVKSVYDKTAIAYDKIKDISNIGIAMQQVLNKYDSSNGEGLQVSELETYLRQYYEKNGIDLENEDSKFNFSTDDVKSLLQTLTENLNNTSKKISATFENDTITIKNNSKESSNKTSVDNNDIVNSLLKVDTDDDYLDVNKIFTNGTYNVSKEAKQELYNELINCKKTDKPFATFDITKDLQGINGDPNSYKFLDSNGNEIQFPDFVNQKEFYIEFTPNNDGNIEYTGFPNIKIHWLDGFSYSVNGAWTLNTIITEDGVPREYTEISHTINGNTMIREVKVPVNIGKSRAFGGYATGTLYYNKTSSGNWVLDENKSRQSFKATGVSNRVQRINGNIEITSNYGGTHGGTGNWSEVNSHIEINKSCNIQIGGTVWLEGAEQKTGQIDGMLGTGDTPFAGIQVQLYDVTQGNTAVIGGNGDQGKLVAITTTDKNGHYRFFGTNDTINGNVIDVEGKSHSMRELLLNPLHKYYVTFVYNGQLYQPTYYHKQLTSPGYSNAKDMSREAFNAKFTRIDSDSANYKSPGTNAWNRAYSSKHKLKTDDGSYISFNGNGRALTYGDAWNQFLTYATNSRNYELNPKNDDASNVWGTKGNSTIWNSQYTGGGKYEISSAALDNSNYSVALDKLKGWLSSKGVSQNEQNNIETFIKDSMMVATTLQENKTYPFDTNKFENYCINNVENPENRTINIGNVGSYKYLYSTDSDQSRWVDFGLTQREVADLALGKDLYKVTMLVNGKKETYNYNKKNLNEDGVWEIKARAADPLFKGTDFYNRPVRSSEYLYNQSNNYNSNGSNNAKNNAKNLQVWVTYKIAIKNQGTVDVDLNNTEIVDYYDASQYTFDGDPNGNTYTPKRYHQNNFDINSYIGKDGNGTILSDNALKVSTEGSGKDRPKHEKINDYDNLYLTGLRSASGSDTLGVGQFSYVYITFKVNGDSNTGRIMLDQNLDNGELSVGKRNIAEINAYSTKYTQNQSIPDNLDGKTRISVSGKTAGLIDTDSNPGSLSTKDLDSDGNIINDANDEVKNRLEDDTDKAPNLKITIDTNKDNVRKFKGMVYEDNRTETSGKSKIGNGIYDNRDDNPEAKINGVTMQLVELVQDVDKNGFATGTYLGEKVWASYQYGDLKAEPSRDYKRYYSGTNSSKVILSGPGILKVYANGLKEGDGQYEFDSIPAGDFYIRFVYGDTTQTTLTNGNNDVNKRVGLKGLNARSYNGQDYKSTVYQNGIDQNSGFNNIKGYTDYENQNYAKVDDLNVNSKESDFTAQGLPIPNKNQMYYYDIDKSTNTKGNNPSDAKDVYDYRKIVNNYSSNNDVDDKGAATSTDSNNGVLNNKAEILSSFEKLATRQKVTRNGSQQEDESDDSLKIRQIEMIRNFMNNTRMVAQTGIINTEIERNTQNLNNITKNGNGYSSTQDYTIDNIDLGLVERPRAQLKLNKEVSNFKIVLANQQVLFNSNKQVNNLVYSKHSGHKVNKTNTYEDLRLYSVEVSANNTKESPELIQAYMDDELLEGAKMQVEYTLTVTNVGEVDYTEKQFYYLGTGGKTISKTNARNVIDYHSNSLKFDGNDNGQWNVKTGDELQPNGQINNYVVNGRYANELKTYDTLLVTDDLSGDLLPELASKDGSSKSTKLVLTSELSSDTAGGNLIFNNLAEIVATTNSQGRRMQFSIVGNQEMADQSLGNNAAKNVYSSEKLVTPSEIDADSAQKIVIMPPTGENKNYIPIVVGSIIGAIAIIGAIVLIRKYVKKQ